MEEHKVVREKLKGINIKVSIWNRLKKASHENELPIVGFIEKLLVEYEKKQENKH